MACSCSSGGKASGKPATFTVTLPGGNEKTYSTEVEAAAAARRGNGSYRQS